MDFPTTLVLEPIQLPHKQTFILLHGRGSTGDKFGTALLETPIGLPAGSLEQEGSSRPTSEPLLTLQTVFPHARFVFPTAARRRATVYRRAYTHQWFNNWKLDPPATEREELQIDGLRETTAFLHDLLRAEISLVPGGAKNVVFGGLSQGCAASLIAISLWEGEGLAAWVGMCGWLPFAERLIEQLPGGKEKSEPPDAGGDEEEFDPFGHDSDEEQDRELETPATRAISWLREELDFPRTASMSVPLPFQGMPLFWGHGVQDDRVSIILGRRGSECLRGMGAKVCSAEYNTLGHWYSSEMLRDLTDFLQRHNI